MPQSPKYLFVTGGVMSGLGKGISAASIGRLLKNLNIDVTAIKIDPYINVDAGTMNPSQHGEVYVLEDGTEADLDLGTYERFLNIEMSEDNNITTGQVYSEVIQDERNGEFLGETVQIIPHVTDRIQSKIKSAAEGSDVCIVEIGGTVGDIEGMPFLESIRQMKLDLSEDDAVFAHVTLVPRNQGGDQKTKPTQHSVKKLRSIGIHPDIIIGRSQSELNDESKDKISMFCDVDRSCVFSNPDMNDIHQLPIYFEDIGIDDEVLDKMNLDHNSTKSSEWNSVVQNDRNHTVSIMVAGKYEIEDAYYSIHQALKHSGFKHGVDVNREWCKTDYISDENWEDIRSCDGIIVPGGFGSRGLEGKIKVCRYARENNIPYLGICFGFQSSIIEYARNVLDLPEANSTEADDQTNHPVIDILPEQQERLGTGNSMRLGSQVTNILEGTLAHDIYGDNKIERRHRHRYEVNPNYIDDLSKYNLKFSGRSGKRMEILELEDHPFYIGTQYHPEFSSTPTSTSPVFDELVRRTLVDDSDD